LTEIDEESLFLSEKHHARLGSNFGASALSLASAPVFRTYNFGSRDTADHHVGRCANASEQDVCALLMLYRGSLPSTTFGRYLGFGLLLGFEQIAGRIMG
jgi:hypothetical protein